MKKSPTVGNGRGVTITVTVPLRSRMEYTLYYYKYPDMMGSMDLLCAIVNPCEEFTIPVIAAPLEQIHEHVFAAGRWEPACNRCHEKFLTALKQKRGADTK